MAFAHRLSIVLACGALLTTPACGHHGGDDDDQTGGDATLALTPATAAITLTPSGGGFAASQSFTVTATTADGATTDVTAKVSWVIDDTNLRFDGAGVATVLAAGPYAIVAQYGAATATASLTASLTTTGLAPGFNPADQAKLDAIPGATAAPSIAYPLAGALFPLNVAPIEIHLQKSDPSQTLARIALSGGALLDYKLYAPCADSPNKPAFPGACIVRLNPAIAAQLAGASEVDDLQLTARLAAADGSKLAESPATAVAWSKVALTGGLYYWTTAGKTDTTFNTAIARYDFNGDASAPSIYLSSDSAPKVPTDTQCVGCHAISPDGAKLTFSLGGSEPGYFSLFDVATTKPIPAQLTAKKFAGMSTFSPDGSRLVTMSYGNLTLRAADAALGVIQDHLFTAQIAEQMSHPFWSPTGNHLAFVSWTPSADDQTAGHITGDMVQGGQIWIADSDGTAMTGAPRLLVPRATGVTSYYPAVSDDDRFVVFNQSRCSGPANTGGWGAGPCDGYNDITAALQVVPVDGGAPFPLIRANGSDAPTTTNSWPRWSPDHGTFRNKRLYWVAFSSRRAYGLSLASGAGADTTKPQLWFAAVAINADGTAPTTDPSFAPVWLPGQDPDLSGPRGNHTPAWTSKVVVIQ